MKYFQRKRRKTRSDLDKDLMASMGINESEMGDCDSSPIIRFRRSKAEIKADREAARIVTIDKLYIDDWVAIKPEEHYPERKPLIARICSVDRDEEVFEAIWWRKVSLFI